MSRPVRRLLVAGVVGALAATGASASSTASAAPTSAGAGSADPRAEVLRSFAAPAKQRAQRADRLPRAADRPEKAAEQTEGATAPRALSAAAPCDDLAVLVTQTLEKSHVSWAEGATNVTVRRQRDGGALKTLVTGSNARGFTDAGHNPLNSVAYTVSATLNGSSVTCRSPEEADAFWSMNTSTGVGLPDLFFGGDDATYGQDLYGPAFAAIGATMARPAFSPTGRLVAGIESIGGVPSLTVRAVGTGALQWSVASPAGTSYDEPAFSPDGQRIVVEQLPLDAPETSNGLFTVPVNGSTHPMTAVPASGGLATADWLLTPGSTTSSTLVAADITTGGGLVTVVAATGVRTPVAGTEGALDPIGLPDGSVLFTTITESGSTVSTMAADGTVTPLVNYGEGTTPRWPVPASDGNIYLYLEEPGDPDPAERTWTINRLDDSGVSNPSALGGTRDGDVGFTGFDIRNKVSAGTSNFGGSAHGDILGRSSTGVLYAYPLSSSSTRFFDTRRQIGTGWGSMRQLIAAGDLNGDAKGDIAAVDGSGVLWLYPGKGSFAFAPRVKIGTGWSSYAVLSVGDFNGDTRADLVARDSAGKLWLYPGTGRGDSSALGARRQIGSGWLGFNAILGPGDWNYDNTADIVAREKSTGTLYLYPGNGTGGFGSRTSLGRGWGGATGWATPEFYSGLTPLFVRTSDGTLWNYDSVGDGVVGGTRYKAGSGWNGLTITG